MSNALLEMERVTMLDVLDRVLETGAVIDGEIDFAVADINLIHLGLKLVLASSATLEQRHARGGREDNYFGSGTSELEQPIEPLPPEMPGSNLAPRFSETAGESAPSKRDLACVPGAPKDVERSDAGAATKLEQGIAKLVLTLVELIRRLMEKQAIRKMETGTLTETQVERLGETFRRLEAKMTELKGVFGLKENELNLDLGPLGQLM